MSIKYYSSKLGIDNRENNSEISVFVDGSEIPAGITDTKGNINLSLSPGKHTLVFDAPYILKSKVEIEIPASGEAMAFVARDLRAGDANNDGEIDIGDFGIFKNCFLEKKCDNNTAPDEWKCNTGAERCCPEKRYCGTDEKKKAADFTGDGKIDIIDFSVFKNNFNQEDEK